MEIKIDGFDTILEYVWWLHNEQGLSWKQIEFDLEERGIPRQQILELKGNFEDLS